MTTTQGAMPVRFISYPTRNDIGLNPVSGRLDDSSPRQRELWAIEFGAAYGFTAYEPQVCTEGKRVVTTELPIVRDETVEFDMPFNVRPMLYGMPVVRPADHVMNIDVTVPANLLPKVDELADMHVSTVHALMVEHVRRTGMAVLDAIFDADDIIIVTDDVDTLVEPTEVIDRIDDDPCHYCGDIDGFHTKNCPFGGLL